MKSVWKMTREKLSNVAADGHIAVPSLKISWSGVTAILISQ